MKIKQLTSYLETIAPPSYQEGYDNAGLIVGDPNAKIKKVLICLDSTEKVLDEAIAKKCNLVIAHHPIIFKGLKKITGKNYVERVILKAIKNDIAIYAIHTNLDNMYYNGVNTRIAERLGLVNTEVLAPKQGFKKLFTYIPIDASDHIKNALFNAGVSTINGSTHLSFSSIGVSTENGEGSVPQVKLEVVYPGVKQGNILKALQKTYPGKHIPYEICSIENPMTKVGAGMVGMLEFPMFPKDFLLFLKKRLNVSCIKHTILTSKKIKKVAVCGGAGGFLLKNAIAKKADIFITADYKYHEFFDADSKIIIADVGHYESEQFTIDLLYEIITNKFSTFAAFRTKVNTNPVRYF